MRTIVETHRIGAHGTSQQASPYEYECRPLSKLQERHEFLRTNLVLVTGRASEQPDFLGSGVSTARQHSPKLWNLEYLCILQKKCIRHDRPQE
jgi:hypothetical protein